MPNPVERDQEIYDNMNNYAMVTARDLRSTGIKFEKMLRRNSRREPQGNRKKRVKKKRR